MTLKTSSGPINFSYLNTHLDDQSDAQRRLGASLILQRARFEAFHSQGGPVLVTGDFNSPSTGTDSGAYMIATGALAPEPLNATFAAKYAVPNGTLSNFVLDDLKAQVPRANVGGNYATYTSFAAPGDTSQYTRIDFVFGGNNGKWCVRGGFLLLLLLMLIPGMPRNTRSAPLSPTTVCLPATTDLSLQTSLSNEFTTTTRCRILFVQQGLLLVHKCKWFLFEQML